MVLMISQQCHPTRGDHDRCSGRIRYINGAKSITTDCNCRCHMFIDPSPDNRPSRTDVNLEIAEVIAQRGTCSRAKVGAVIAREGRIIATGYNGAPAGLPHCNHALNEMEGCKNAEHAERNAIVYAARYGLSTDGCNLYATYSPCLDCARAIINAGIISVHFRNKYRDESGLQLLTQAGVEWYHSFS